MPDAVAHFSAPRPAATQPETRLSPGAKTFVGSCLAFAVALGFYVLTLAPTVVWGDSAWLSLNAFWGTSRMGTAGDHPLFLRVGHAFSLLPGDVARNVNLASAFFGAVCVAFVYRAGRHLGARPLAAAAGASALAVSHGFWLHAVMAEVYTANALFLAASIDLLLVWSARPTWIRLVAALGVFAVGLTNHLVLMTAAPAVAAFVLATLGRQLWTRRAAFWALGIVLCGLLMFLIFRDAAGAMLWKLWAGPPGISEYISLRVSPGPALREAAYYVLYFVYQFPSIALVLGLLGFWSLVRDRRKAGILLLLAVAGNAAVFLRHTDWLSPGSAKYVFYIADYTVFAIASAAGAEAVLRQAERRSGAFTPDRLGAAMLMVVALAPVLAYGIMPTVTKYLGADVVRARELPYRDNARFFLNPSKRGDDGARRFGREALDAARPGGVIFADFTPCFVLKYLQVVERRRPDLLLCGEEWGGARVPVYWVRNEEGSRPIYVASADERYYDFSRLGGAYELVPVGPIYEVRSR